MRDGMASSVHAEAIPLASLYMTAIARSRSSPSIRLSETYAGFSFKRFRNWLLPPRSSKNSYAKRIFSDTFREPYTRPAMYPRPV